MKKPKIIIAGCLLLALAAFQGCQNCDPMVQEARTSCENRINAVKDSLVNVWRQDADALRGEYEPRLRSLDSTYRSMNQPK